MLAEKFKKKMKAGEKASGIDTEMNEFDVLVEENVGKEEEFDKKSVRAQGKRRPK